MSWKRKLGNDWGRLGMMSEWRTIRAADFIDFNPRLNLKKGAITTKVAMDKLKPFTKKIPETEKAEFNGGAKFCNGDTVMARITPCLENGKTAYVDMLDDGEIGFGSTEFIVMRAKAGISDPQFVYYTAINPTFRNVAIKSMVGSSGRQRVQQSVLEELELSVPGLDEQRRIGAFLAELDEKIALNNKINDNLQQQAMSLYAEMFLNSSDSNVTSGTLSDIAVITMGQSPSGSSYNEDGVGEVFYQGRAEFGFRFPKRRLFTTEPKRIAEAGDVLLSVRAPVGDLNIAYERCCIGRGLGAIHSKTDHSSFVLYTMFALRSQLDVFNGEGTVFGSINRDALNAIPIDIPPVTEIDQFEVVAHPIDELIRANYEENCRLEAIRDSLLPKLMSGEIDISAVQL